MSNSKRYNSNSEGSNRQLYDPVQAVLHGLQGQRSGNFATNPPRSDELLAHLQKNFQREGNSEIFQQMESTIIQASNIKYQGIPCQKEGDNKGRSPSSFYQQASSQPASPRREEEQEKELEVTITPKLKNPKDPKRCYGNFFKHGQNLDGIQGQRGTKNETTSFFKEIALSPDVVNNLTELKNSILLLKEIKNILSSLTQNFVQDKKEMDSIRFMV
ncbi:hypothetical protein O181_130361 [Austropuccinia psidii MF-1]|uniref:Uncharacterized protein n=1 Tax=Austropuccinia psidii MF-1 TaxID=1389203 RepID=A0A9Q3Q9E0_9BASI|nr:hypothetical protein [Austropuccinia psidii MF-1]